MVWRPFWAGDQTVRRLFQLRAGKRGRQSPIGWEGPGAPPPGRRAEGKRGRRPRRRPGCCSGSGPAAEDSRRGPPSTDGKLPLTTKGAGHRGAGPGPQRDAAAAVGGEGGPPGPRRDLPPVKRPPAHFMAAAWSISRRGWEGPTPPRRRAGPSGEQPLPPQNAAARPAPAAGSGALPSPGPWHLRKEMVRGDRIPPPPSDRGPFPQRDGKTLFSFPPCRGRPPLQTGKKRGIF